MYAFFVFSYLTKKRKNILALGIIGIIFNAAAYILLGAWTGLAMCAIALFRNLYSVWDESRNKKASTKITARDVVVLLITIAAIIVATIPTYNGFLSLMSTFGTITYSYSVWQKNPIIYKFLGMPVSVFWIVYNSFVGSIFGVILESVLLVSAVVGYVNALRNKKDNERRKRHA